MIISRRRKWHILSDLIDEIAYDSTLDQCARDLECVCYAPCLGYRSWIFKYKAVYVALFDAGNGHYAFHMPATRIDVLIAKAIKRINDMLDSRRNRSII